MPEWEITRVNDMGAAEGRRSIQVIDFRTCSINLPPLHEPADDSDNEDFFTDLNDNESSFHDCFASPSDQRSNDSTLDDCTLNINNINKNNDNAATDTVADAIETNNNSNSNMSHIDQSSDPTNEYETSSNSNAPTIASSDDASDFGSTLNDTPANENNEDEYTPDADNEHDNLDIDNVGT